MNTIVEIPRMTDLPAELTTRAQWVCWRREIRDGKMTKIPMNPHNGRNASSTDPSTWSTFDHASEVARQQMWGIGFVLTDDDGLVGIDLDHAIDPATGDLRPGAQQLVDHLDSYTEISPSGDGIHVFIQGHIPAGGKNRTTTDDGWGLEIYERGRFLTVTGRSLHEPPPPIRDAQVELEGVYDEYFGAPEPIIVWSAAEEPPSQPWGFASSGNSPPLDDEDVLAKARAAKNSDKLDRLWHGDISGYDDDDSRADLALCGLLAFWTQDPAQIDRLFRRSGLYREKWEREDYRRRTIEEALAHRTEVWQPGSSQAERDDPLLTLHQTDVGNAKRLVNLHGDDLRYCAAWNQWLVWDGRRWMKDDTGEIERRAKQTIEALLRVAMRLPSDEEARAKLIRHALNSEAQPRISRMIKLAQTEQAVVVTPDDLDRPEKTAELLNVRNGTINLRTGALQSHDRNDFITQLIDVDHDPAATAPTWGAFLRRIVPDPELRAYLQLAIGYSATGYTSERKLFVAWGTGANGKSTLIETIRTVLGEYARRIEAGTLLAKLHDGPSNDIARLQGARFVAAAETNQGRRLDEAKIKDLTGGERLAARFLYGEFFEFTPMFTLWLATNYKPDIQGTDDGIWDRIALIPFTQRIPEGERDLELPAKLKAEAPGILAWAVTGSIEWFRQGLAAPAGVRAATNDYRSEMDLVGQFLEERCDRSDPAAFTSSDELTHAYHDWAKAAGVQPMTKQMLGRRLKELGLQDGRRTLFGRETRGWIGVMVPEPSILEFDDDTIDTISPLQQKSLIRSG